MKPISELVKIREQLSSIYNTAPIAKCVDLLDESLRGISGEIAIPEIKNDVAELVDDLNTVHTKLKFNNDRYRALIDQIDHLIQAESTKFLTENYSLELRVKDEAVGNIRKIRVLDIRPEIEEVILNRIGLYTDWRYPALEIGCRDGEWTKKMISADPLYITDHYRDFLESAVKDFPEENQRRIRPYLTKDADLSMLPQAQMAFVFCWNFLNYRSLDTVKEYLKSVKEVLRPGGVFMFSYNNGDMYECAGYAEGHWMSYIPKSLLVPMCESLGYEVVHTQESRGDGTALSWIELKKHGELNTVKAHQVLGEIKRIDA